MSPEAASHVAMADLELAEATRALDHHLTRMAARSAYYATFRAAEAFIVERTGKIAKTHTGVRSEFARLWRTLPHVDQSLTKILSQGYSMKEAVDYGFGLAGALTDSQVSVLLADAERFVRDVRREIVGGSGSLSA